MGKEAKIGIVVVGLLAGALIGLAVNRFVLSSPAVSVPSADSVAEQPQPATSDQAPTVVTAQQDAVVHDNIDSRMWATSEGEPSAGMPRGSFLPDEDVEPNPRYVRQVEPQPLEPTPADANPFAQPLAADPQPAAAPQEMEVAPQGAAELEARRPSRNVRNPLRQMSAEVPEGQEGQDVQFPEDNGTFDDPFPEVNPAADEAMPDDDAGADAFAPQGQDESLGLQAPTGPGQSAADEYSYDQDGAAGANPFDAPAVEPKADQFAQPQTSPFDNQSADAFNDPQPAATQPTAEYRPPAEYRQPMRQETPLPAGRAPLQPTRPADGRYTVEPNDSLWKVSEKVYGDGRYFKAIGEHNRARLAHPDQLLAGDVLEVPPKEMLQQRYPSLCPRERRSAVVESRTVQAAAQEPISRADAYIVAEGDTLFDIARYELGKASRWGEIYELNRDKLGEDFDFLQPGLELRMPPRDRSEMSRQAVDRYQR
jgi:nucleoid-associated protein YgaU